MRLILAGVGRLKSGPERDLLERYVTRVRSVGRRLGFSPFDLVEIDEGRLPSAAERMRLEAKLLAARLPEGSALVALDERGRAITSHEFATHLRGERDRGAAALALVIGGPDGFDAAFRQKAGLVFGFGAATIPHQLVRILAAEQIYRAMTIIAGHPYHRE